MSHAADENFTFDLLEELKCHFPMIAGGFARGTGGIDKEYILRVIRETTPASTLIPTLVNEVVEEAQQACRYHAKYKQREDDGRFSDGYIAGCERLGETSLIADHIVRHEERILDSVGYKKTDRGYISIRKTMDATKLVQTMRLAIVQALQSKPTIKQKYVGIVGLVYRSVVGYDGTNPNTVLRKALEECDRKLFPKGRSDTQDANRVTS